MTTKRLTILLCLLGALLLARYLRGTWNPLNREEKHGIK